MFLHKTNNTTPCYLRELGTKKILLLTSVDELNEKEFPFGSWQYWAILYRRTRNPGPIGLLPALKKKKPYDMLLFKLS